MVATLPSWIGHFLHLALLLPTVFARHQILSGQPSLVSHEVTVDSGFSQGSAKIFKPDESAWIYATLRSPTTHMITFSPDRLPISRSKMQKTSSLGTFNRTIHKLVVQQRACRLKTTASYESCYNAPFDSSMPQSKDRGYEFYRKGGTGGRSDADVAGMRGIEQETGVNVPTQFEALGFKGLKTVENACNNHRAVSVDVAEPTIPQQYPAIDWTDIFYNDAEVR